MVTISPAFAGFTEQMHGDKGRAWLARLPAILTDCAARWGLRLGAPFANLTYHFVISATRGNGQPVVIKACAPTGEYAQEAAALRHFAGVGMAQLLAADDDDAVLLLERLLPGTTLLSVADDDAATRVAARVMRALWRPLAGDFPFPTIQQWDLGLTRLRTYYGGSTGPFPPELVAEAEAIGAEFMATLAPPVLLHGDLHHDNILAAERAPWLAIDPKGVIGEPAYEVGAFLNNPQPRLQQTADLRQTLARRIAILAEELGFDQARIRGWGLYHDVLSAWWDVEDLGRMGPIALTCAQALATLAP